MPFDLSRARPLLQKGDFCRLFIEELGWEPSRRKLTLRAGDRDFAFTAIAEKRGFMAWVCQSHDGGLADHATRLKLDRALAQTSFEHLIVFVTANLDRQLWMWVRRETGKPLSARTHEFTRGQPGDSLLQKLQILFVSLEEEEAGLSVTQVAGRARAAFDIERITKAFYRDFDVQRKAFLKFIEGIEEVADREWYASVMLNRLMFVYFIQRKGFLDSDPYYLRNRLTRCQQEKGKDKFYSFYRYFLLRLFHEGFGQRPNQRAAGLERLLGRIPYLNGGIFDAHELEKPDRYGKSIQIPDKAFERIFTFLDGYDWVLDPTHQDFGPTHGRQDLKKKEEINPDVLGYIFEKYINQKQMGAYYTKEDITEYISKNTVLPFLFEATQARCKVAFENPSGPAVWDLLREDPDRYIYHAVRHGLSWDVYANNGKGGALDAPRPLPREIAVGLDTTRPDLIERRKAWNKPAPVTHALPTEIWREVVARRNRCEEIHRKLAAGDVADINDLITLNLDIRQFAQDAIANCEGPDLLRAFWHAIEKVTILDPTCGSGAFLFAALNILEPLYEACLDRMEIFLREEADKLESASRRLLPAGNPILPRKKLEDFTRILDRLAAHPNRRYFIFKSIILNNLFGVDIMEEAVEICKLRLFLKLAAQVEPDASGENLGIEPLPDIDFNIRAGNTLVGYATYNEVKKAVGSAFDFDNAMEKISVKAADLQQTFDKFRQLQTEGDSSVPTEHKLELQRRLKALEDELNRHLAGEYAVKVGDKAAYAAWIKSHRPFHWFIEFYGILNSGGFDVIIGNPPYVVNTPEKVAYEIKEGLFKTYSCKNLYAFIYERSLQLAHENSSVGLIVQLTALSSEKMSPLQDLLLRRGLLIAPSFPRRPESIFDGVEMPVTILISRSRNAGMFTSRVSRFYSEERPQALNLMALMSHEARLHGHRVGKLGTALEAEIFLKLNKANLYLETLTSASSDHVLYYQEACRYWVKACKGYPFFRRNGERMAPPHGRTVCFTTREACAFAACLINSTLFYWFYSGFSDCEHINDALVRTIRVPHPWEKIDWIGHESRLARSLKEYSTRKTITTKQGHKIEYDELDASKSKPLLDEIDCILAQHYGFTEEELDFILNYDIKYRLGRDAEREEE